MEQILGNYKNYFRGSNQQLTLLLEQQDTTIDQLLNQNSFINMYKSESVSAIKIMTYQKMETLVKYITQVGPSQNVERSYKFPMIACQLLSSDNKTIIDFFFSNGFLMIQDSIYKKTEYYQELKKKQIQPAEEKDVIQKVDKQGQEQNKQVPQNNDVQAQQKQVSTKKVDEFSDDNIQQKDAQKQSSEIKQFKLIPPLIDKLFSYFQGEVNYTLAGYVCKVLTAFLNKKPILVIEYILKTQRFRCLINHLESRSVGDLLANIFLYKMSDQISIRKDAFKLLLNQLSQDKQIYIISNFAIVLCEMIHKLSQEQNQISNQLYSQYFTLDTIKTIMWNSISDILNVSVYNSKIFSLYMTEMFFKKPLEAHSVAFFKESLSQYFKGVFLILDNSIKENVSVGIGRIRLVETTSLLLRHNLAECQDIVGSLPNFFQILFQLLKKHPLNNILHNQILRITNFALEAAEQSKIQNLLIDNNFLLQFLADETKKDISLKNSEQRRRMGYIGHLIKIVRKMQQIATNNSKLASIIQDEQFDFILTNLVEQQLYKSNKTLAGFFLIKQADHISFDRSQILQNNLKFLLGAQPPIFPTPEEELILENQKIDEANAENGYITIQNLISIDFEAEEEKLDLKYWNTHLDYNVDDLIDDL